MFYDVSLIVLFVVGFGFVMIFGYFVLLLKMLLFVGYLFVGIVIGFGMFGFVGDLLFV